MKAVFLHVLADALGSVIVIISALLNIYSKVLGLPSYIVNYIDPVLCLALVILILSSTIPLRNYKTQLFILNPKSNFHNKHFFLLSKRISFNFVANSAKRNRYKTTQTRHR